MPAPPIKKLKLTNFDPGHGSVAYVNNKNIRQYFKILFSEDANLMPLHPKDKFHDTFPNIDISTKEIDHCIRSQYRIIKKLHSEKITNTESLCIFLDKEGLIFKQFYNIIWKIILIKYIN